MKLYITTSIVVLAVLFGGCDGNSEAELAKRLIEVEQALEQKTLELAHVRASLEKREAEEQKRRAGSASPLQGVKFTDLRKNVTVEILQILTGEQLVRNSKLHKVTLEEIWKQGKEAIYFEIKVINEKHLTQLRVSQDSFSLESVEGEIFTVQHTRDSIRGIINGGQSVRGGIAFAIHSDSLPRLLRYDTGLKDALGSPLEAQSPFLAPLLSQ